MGSFWPSDNSITTPLISLSSSGLPVISRTRTLNTAFSSCLNWLLSTQVGPVWPLPVLPRTMSPSMKIDWACCACAGATKASHDRKIEPDENLTEPDTDFMRCPFVRRPRDDPAHAY